MNRTVFKTPLPCGWDVRRPIISQREANVARKINSTELHKSFSRWLGWILGTRNRTLVVQSHGQLLAAILTINKYKRYLALKQSLELQELEVVLPVQHPLKLLSLHLKNPNDAAHFVMQLTVDN